MTDDQSRRPLKANIRAILARPERYNRKKMFSGTKNKWLVLVAIAAFAAFVVACGTDETGVVSDNGSGGVGARPTQEPVEQGPLPDGDYEVVEVLAPIESVELLVLESYPEQFVIQIVSGLPSGCASFSRTETTQDGTDIKISVYNLVPSPDQLAVISCTAIYGINEVSVALGSDFERGTTYTVLVNDYPGVTFETDSTPIQTDPSNTDPGFVIEPTTVEALEVYVGDDTRGQIPYHVSVLVGLSDGCKELIESNVVKSSRTVFDISPMVKLPTGAVACTDDYRLEGVVVDLGVVGEDLIACTLYTVNAGKESVEFQAIAPNVRCTDPVGTPPSAGGGIIADSQALELALKALGADVEVGGESSAAKRFGLIPTEMKVNGEQVLLYEFAPGTSADRASETVSKDGSTFELEDGTVASVMWIAPPHFYLFGNAIILYIGNDVEMGTLLDSVANKFAGGDYDQTSDDEVVEDSEFTERLAMIERVSIASTRSIPAQHLIGVTIALGGSCETFKSIEWSVQGREVSIEVLTQVPTAPVPCTLAIIYEDQSINIGSDFETGVEYDVIVNGERQGTLFGG